MVVNDARPSPFTQLATQADWESLINALGLPDGVNDVPGGPSLKPGLDTIGRNVTMDPGIAVIKGQVWSCTDQQLVPIPAPSGLNRIDRLALRYDRGAAASAGVISPVLIAGTPASTPVEPSLQRTSAGAYDIPIGSWLSQSGGGLISLIDERQFAGNAVLIGTTLSKPTPAEPCLLIETDVPDIVLWNGSAWVSVTKPPVVRNYKTSDTGRSSTTLSNDGSLSVTLQPNSIYHITAAIGYHGGAGASAGGLQWGWAFPAGSLGQYAATYIPGTNTGITQWWDWADSSMWAQTYGTSGFGNNYAITVDGWITTGTTGGALTFMWAKATAGSPAVNTTVLKNSFIVAEKV